MKRLNGLFDKICTLDNIELADKYARRGKHNWGIFKHNKHPKEDNIKLLEALKNGTYRTSLYSTFKIYEPKERTIFRLPYYPDRIVHWAIMNVMEPIWTSIFIEHTYSCIKGRGIHKLLQDLKQELKDDVEGTRYCLKLDIKKFYPSIDHEVLKSILRKKIKDIKLLKLFDEIIDSAQGVPIGNYLSQFFANLYLSYFDHWLLESVKVKHYFRYADDIIILSDNPAFLKNVLVAIKFYLKNILNLELKPNYQVYDINKRGIDFVGYVFYPSYIKIRKSIKIKLNTLLLRYIRGVIAFEDLQKRIVSYLGWLKFCNSKHLLRKIEYYTGLHFSNWRGKTTSIRKMNGKVVRLIEIVKHKSYIKIHFMYKHISYSIKTTSKYLWNKLSLFNFPINYKFKSIC